MPICEDFVLKFRENKILPKISESTVPSGPANENLVLISNANTVPFIANVDVFQRD